MPSTRSRYGVGPLLLVGSSIVGVSACRGATDSVADERDTAPRVGESQVRQEPIDAGMEVVAVALPLELMTTTSGEPDGLRLTSRPGWSPWQRLLVRGPAVDGRLSVELNPAIDCRITGGWLRLRGWIPVDALLPVIADDTRIEAGDTQVVVLGGTPIDGATARIESNGWSLQVAVPPDRIARRARTNERFACDGGVDLGLEVIASMLDELAPEVPEHGGLHGAKFWVGSTGERRMDGPFFVGDRCLAARVGNSDACVTEPFDASEAADEGPTRMYHHHPSYDSLFGAIEPLDYDRSIAWALDAGTTLYTVRGHAIGETLENRGWFEASRELEGRVCFEFELSALEPIELCAASESVLHSYTGPLSVELWPTGRAVETADFISGQLLNELYVCARFELGVDPALPRTWEVTMFVDTAGRVTAIAPRSPGDVTLDRITSCFDESTRDQSAGQPIVGKLRLAAGSRAADRRRPVRAPRPGHRR